MKKSFSLSVVVLMLIVVLSACGGGGGGGGGGPATLVSIAVTPASPSIAKGTTQQFTATGTFSDSATQDLTASATWSSSDTAVATINSAGLSTSVAAGTTTITATSGGISGTATLTVTNATLASIAVTPANPSIAKGTIQQFTATGTFSDNTTQDLTTQVAWSSSDTGKATIISAGLATSIAVGTTTIKATSGSISGTATLTVTAAILTSIAVTPAAPGIVRSATRQFTATGVYTDSTTNDLTSSVTWGSSFTSVATISTGGMATPLAAGTTTITAVSGSISGNTTLTVQGVNLPRTGQTTCYDAVGAVISCATTTGQGQDGASQKGVAWPGTRFTDNSNGTVTDNLTGLIWLKDANCTFGGLNNYRNWADALTAANGLANSQCGLTDGSTAGDWRLPNRKELRSLINYGQANTATWLNNQGFSNVQADVYWSSSTYAANTTFAWGVYMIDGNVYYDPKTDNSCAWPVRSGQ